MKKIVQNTLGDFHAAIIAPFTLQQYITFIIFFLIKTFYCQINQLLKNKMYMYQVKKYTCTIVHVRQEEIT